MSTFITIMAWIFGAVSLIRFLAIILIPPSKTQQALIDVAELCGQNPIGAALVKASALFVVCAAWLVSYYFFV